MLISLLNLLSYFINTVLGIFFHRKQDNRF